MRHLQHFAHVLLIGLFVVSAAQMPAQPDDTTIGGTATTAAGDEESTQPASLLSTINNVFGEKGVTLQTSRENGEIIQTSNDKGEIISLIARNKVVLRSEKLDLESEYLQIDALNQKVIATGNVHLRIQDKTAICGRFEHDIQKKLTILRDQPRIIGAGQDGQRVDVTSCVILIQEDAQGNTQTTLRACSETENVLSIGTEPTPVRPSSEKPVPPTPIDVNNPSDVNRVLEPEGRSQTRMPPARPSLSPVSPSPTPESVKNSSTGPLSKPQTSTASTPKDPGLTAETFTGQFSQ